MDKKEKLTENVKVRVSTNEKNFIEEAARSEGMSMSELIRHSIFDAKNTTDYAAKIQRNKVKHEIRNKIVSMNLSKATRDKILKEMNFID